MTRQQYINRTIRALCGDAPARPDVYHNVVRMTDSLKDVYEFDRERK